MIRREIALFAGITATALAALYAASPAQALTIENYSGAAGNGPASGWVDLNYNDPNRKPSRDGDKRSLDGGPGSTNFRFGPAEPSWNSRYNQNGYFSPNYLMGK